MRNIYLLIALLIGFGSASANVIINGTRFIYPENHKDIVMQLVNKGDQPALVQSWIDDGDMNSTPETAKVPFLLTPPVVKVSGHNGQQLRIKKLPAQLPGDRESVFYINILDIPPVPEHLTGQNTVQLAVKSRIKLFYRPAALTGKPEEAVNGLRLVADGHRLRLINNSPFHISIANIENPAKTKLLADSVMVAPFGEARASSKTAVTKGQRYQLFYVDDMGAYKSKVYISE